MNISLIVAMANNRTIGLNNKMPWHLSADLKKFKQITLGNPIIMGRKTFESIGKPLPGRKNIIISHNPAYEQPGCLVVNVISQALQACTNHPEIFIIGGASLYQFMLPQADTIYLTQIHKTFQGDTFFPPLNADEWREQTRQDITHDPSVDFSYSFIKLIKC